MKILWFTWKDLQNPLAGGAEVVNEQLAKRLVAGGHQVTLLVGGFAGGAAQETHADGYDILRVGNRYTVYWQAYKYYKRQLRGWADLVIEEVNTVPFFASCYVREPHVLFMHQLAGKIWFYEMPQPLSTIGYLLEPWYLKLLRGQPVITVSESTKADLQRAGYKAGDITIISEGLETAPLAKLPPLSSKARHPTLLSLGSMRAMKQTADQVKAFELAKAELPELQLWLAGDSSGAYGKKVLVAVDASPYKADITVFGRVPAATKLQLMREAWAIGVTSVKEGWGLIVTEANSQGTPAVVYDVDGLRDSVRDGETGLVSRQNTPPGLANQLVALIGDKTNYQRLRKAGWQWSKSITFEQCYQDFLAVIGKVR